LNEEITSLKATITDYLRSMRARARACVCVCVCENSWGN